MRVTELNIYPVKSARGISLGEVALTARGFANDRRWMLVNPDNSFITAREFPELTLVTPAITQTSLSLKAPSMPELVLKLNVSPGSAIQVEIWGQQVAACLAGTEAADWFSAYLQRDCRLVCMAEDQHRRVDPNFGRNTDEVSFADGFPMLLISDASLNELNSRLDNPVSMRRFRPNLVVSTAENFTESCVEDSWLKIRAGEVEFECVKACARCIFTTIDPETGLKDPHQEPLRTLGSYRRDPAGGVNFGQNLIPRSLGTIRLGDSVEVLKTKDL